MAADAYVDEISRGLIGHAVPKFFERHFRPAGAWTRTPISDDDRRIVKEARSQRRLAMEAAQ